MNKSEIKVYVNQGWGDFRIIWLIKRELDKAYNGVIKNGVIEWEEVKEGVNPETPFLKLPYFVWQEIVDALTEEMPPTKKEAVDAELNATKYHLEDMRKLVFKSK